MAPSDGCQQADDFELERLRDLAAHCRNDIIRQHRGLADSVLRGGWIELSGIQRIGHERAVAQCPHAGPIRYLKTIVRDDAAPLLGAGQSRQQRWWGGARGPDEHTGGDLRAIIQRHFLTVITGDFGLEANLHAAPGEPLLGVATEAYP